MKPAIRMDDFEDLEACILVGGRGTRLRPVVSDRPKVLAPVGGRPFLTHLLDQLREAGIRRCVLCTGYLAEQVEQTLGRDYDGISLLYSQEDQPLGTAGALVQALDLLQGGTVLALNGDSICDCDLAASLACHRTRAAQTTIVMAHVTQGDRYGRVVTSDQGDVLRFSEKSPEAGPGWINAGLYWIERPVLERLPRGKSLSLEREVLPSLIGQGLHGFRQHGAFLDIGVPEDYAKADAFLQLMPNAPAAQPA